MSLAHSGRTRRTGLTGLTWRAVRKMSAMRLAARLSAIFVVVLVLAGAWLVFSLTLELRQSIDAALVDSHDEIAGSVETEAELLAFYLALDEGEALVGPLGYLGRDGTLAGDFRAEVFDTTGFATLSLEELVLPEVLNEYAPFLGEEGSDFETTAWRVYVAPAFFGLLAVAEPVDLVEDALVLVPTIVIGIGAVMVGITLAAGLVLGIGQQRRMEHIKAAMARLAEGDFATQAAPEQPRDDLDEVMEGIDAAAGQLEQSFGQLTHFSQNVAHELRTPLARLRAEIESIDGPEGEAALARADEVIRVFDAIGRIARLSRTADRSSFSDVDLGAVAGLMDALFAEVAEDQGQRLVLELDAPAVVRGDRQMLGQMASNLVENALKYAGPGAEIRVRAAGRVLSVADTGPGVPAADRARIFAAFERLDRDRSAAGSGLGLALVQAIARYHRAEVSLSDAGGTVVTLRFPAGDGG